MIMILMRSMIQKKNRNAAEIEFLRKLPIDTLYLMRYDVLDGKPYPLVDGKPKPLQGYLRFKYANKKTASLDPYSRCGRSPNKKKWGP